MTSRREIRFTDQADLNLIARRPLLDLLLADSERQLESASATSAAMGTRAAILIASAGIVSSLNVPHHLTLDWYAFALGFGILAALLGISVLLPRIAREVDIPQIETDAWNALDVEAVRMILYSRLEVLKRDKRAIRRRAIFVLAGFTALALSLISVGLQLSNVPFPV